MEIEKLPNIGPKLAEALRAAGILSGDDLAKIGSVGALLKVNGLSFNEGCLNKLYAFEGAIRGVRWHDLPKAARETVKREYFAKIGKA